MRQCLLIKLLLLASMLSIIQIGKVYAADKRYVVDVYGTNEITSQQIESKFKKELTILATSAVGATLPEAKRAAFNKALSTLMHSLQSTKNYTLVNLSPITYSSGSLCYIAFDYIRTVDLSKLNQQWLPKPTKHVPDNYHLISNWQEYFSLSNKLIFAEKINIKVKQCPAHHCMFGFDHPRLEKYKAIFNKAEMHKANLITIMRQDSDGEKRAAAVFLLAHIKDRNELVRLILPSLNDSYSGVRNNVLRVLIYIAQKDKKVSLPLDKLFALTGFPNVMERNKALYVLAAVAENPHYAALIKRSIGKQLMDNLKLQQPSNHEPAYEILKKISGKDYGERDYRSWERYLSH